jgi:hypothetical protein
MYSHSLILDYPNVITYSTVSLSSSTVSLSSSTPYYTSAPAIIEHYEPETRCPYCHSRGGFDQRGNCPCCGAPK